jgi:hypothetical protein
MYAYIHTYIHIWHVCVQIMRVESERDAAREADREVRARERRELEDAIAANR